jgi:uncharacterized protein (DUF2236 family)
VSRDTLSNSREVTRLVNREVVVVLGWGRAILLQLAHPLVAAAVADRSAFQTDTRAYARRAWHTVNAMLRLTFGTEEDVHEVASRINAIHHSVGGTLAEAAGMFPKGTRYSATDSALLAWVHATLLDSLPFAYEQFVRPLTPEEHDRYCAEARMVAALLEFGEQPVPSSRDELKRYMSRVFASGEIQVTERARMTADALFHPLRGPGTTWLTWFLRTITLGLLPPEIRDAYVPTWNTSDERAFRRCVRFVRWTRSITPVVLREWPAARRAG